MTQDEYIKLTYDGLHIAQAQNFPTIKPTYVIADGRLTHMPTGVSVIVSSNKIDVIRRAHVQLKRAVRAFDQQKDNAS